jgi:hypothetical protein
MVSSQEAIVSRQYEIHDPAMAAIDASCVAMAMKTLNSAEGFEGLELQSPNQWDSNVRGVSIASYTHVSFNSSFGDAKGSMTCVAVPSQNVIAELAFKFDAPGLAGLRTIPGRSVADSKISGFTDLNPFQMIGTK